MKVIIEVNNGKFKKDDLLIWNGEEFVGISKAKIIAENTENIAKLKEEIKSLKEQINTKLKEYHDILQTLTKEA